MGVILPTAQVTGDRKAGVEVWPYVPCIAQISLNQRIEVIL